MTVPPNSWTAHPGGPSFEPLPGRSVITQIAWPLLAWLDDWLVSWGSVTLLRPGLAITATHAVESLLEKWGVAMRPSGTAEVVAAPFHLFMVQDGDVPGVGFLWRAHRLVACAGTDVTVLVLSPYSDNFEQAPRVGPKITFHPPALGSRVVAFGYPRTSTEIERGSEAESVILTHNTNGHTAVGTVDEVHMGGRDKVHLPFPCFRTTARFDPGMSGGPVFNEYGRLCGVACGGTDGDPLLNYAALMWPTGVAEVDISNESSPPDLQTLCGLAKAGLIDLIGCDRIRGKSGEIIGWEVDRT